MAVSGSGSFMSSYQFILLFRGVLINFLSMSLHAFQRNAYLTTGIKMTSKNGIYKMQPNASLILILNYNQLHAPIFKAEVNN